MLGIFKEGKCFLIYDLEKQRAEEYPGGGVTGETDKKSCINRGRGKGMTYNL